MSGRARLGIAAILVIATALVAAYFWRLEVTTRTLQHLLEARGVVSPRLRVTQLDLSGITIRDVGLGDPPEFEAALLRAEVDWWDDRTGLRAFEIEDARLAIDLREGAAPFGALQGPLSALFAPSAEVSESTPTLPGIQIRDALLDLRTEEGGVELAVDLELEDAASEGVTEGALELEAVSPLWNDIRLRGARVSLPLRIALSSDGARIEWWNGSLQLPDLDVVGAVGSVDARLVDGAVVGALSAGAERVELASQRLAMQDLELELTLPFSSRPVRVSKMTLSDLDPEPRFPATEIAATLSRSADGVTWQVEGEASAASAPLQAKFAGVLDAEYAGNLRIDFAPLRFERGGLQPETLQAGLGVLRDVDGTLEATAQIAWTAEGLSESQGKIQVSNLSFRGPTAQVEDTGGSLELLSLFPPRSAPHQAIRAAGIQTGGLKFEDARANYQLLPVPGAPGTRLHLEEASLKLGTGSLRVADAALDPAAPREFVVRAERLRLEELARLLDVAEIAGSGTISGAIPVRIEDESLRITGGVLKSEGPGILNIRADFARKALESAGETAMQVGRALEDFHYERLRITIDKPFQGTSQLGVHALGMNPEVLDGQPFDLHINIETDLEPLLRAASLGLRVPAEWSRRNTRQSQ